MTSHSEPRTGEFGFTLIEIIVVMTILGLLMALIVASGTRVSPAVHARAAAEAISGALRSARSEAVMSNRSVAFTLDLGNRSYQWGPTPPQPLPDDLRLSLLTSRELLAPTGSTGVVRFDPDGGSSGGRVTIEGGGVVWWVGIDWLSGRVSIEEKQR